MWSEIRHKTIIYEDPIIVDQYNKYYKTHYIGEDYPIRGCLGRSDWSNRPLEEFCRFIRERYKAIKVVGLEIFTEDEFQITYYLNHRLEGKPHIIQPRYLLGKYGAEGLLFKPISFDVYLTDPNIDDL